ncbi:MAG: YbaB/EbfC family nucleoid-associated protein [Phycisphaerales bacterium]|nr:MAG: YbaB/EbfC family nucleoid-associated protein [Phycisphaerales bacterium]
MLGNLGNLAGLLKSAKELQSNMAAMQAELAAKRYSAEAGGGQVRATVDGRATLVDIKIAPEATADVELLEDLITAAVGAAVKRSQEALQAEMSRLAGGMPLPPGLADLMNQNR